MLVLLVDVGPLLVGLEPLLAPVVLPAPGVACKVGVLGLGGAIVAPDTVTLLPEVPEIVCPFTTTIPPQIWLPHALDSEASSLLTLALTDSTLLDTEASLLLRLALKEGPSAGLSSVVDWADAEIVKERKRIVRAWVKCIFGLKSKKEEQR